MEKRDGRSERPVSECYRIGGLLDPDFDASESDLVEIVEEIQRGRIIGQLDE